MAQKCPECDNGELQINDAWDKEYDRLESNRPSGDIIHRDLAKKGVPKYVCNSCDYVKISLD